ncbi:TPA: sigma-54-dependent Fis family transcriptional regulator [Burkholderia aenigmatica]|uniref:sigma-54-dependent transcriptional regulator n=1 Tax=Burkholderia sp. AU45251 TaxID=3059204 RepID=UPI00265533B5|nr:sigma-54 dependent transcriptional regulator [Burkholderia sp. AU45251]HDR9482093.1 sigma-54-dependent Fis family transcriptional regulator [Burkholderia aenigmatica]MDN7515272.1 sigma-54 dependent transcriptional regulator [Burkholderia sp. AU45251]HDR9515560.1 sigma-54-dependent Fis family transcriptional regulator [Burkholderia aenigmatica]HDR9590464.1 sigma-54-dependent Fis family transcriptional regulator [Burkholderia aenigmatica]HDR9598837.1 sigma-54-dependent Fis family transcriptio
MPYVLIVEDDADTRTMLAALARMQQLSCDTAATLEEARTLVTTLTPDLVLCDLVLPDGNGMELFDALPKNSHCEMVMTTGHASLETAIDALRRGATDYLVKPLNMQRLNSIFARVPRTTALHEEIAELRSELQRLGRFGRMLGSSPAMQAVYDAIGRVARTEASVLLTGESGTGKELAAQTVHDLSLRRRGPFLAVNCGAIATNLVESEMFGHDRGSFTGAERQHKGFFERADGGTLLLDEITEMPLESQVKLLRVLETGRLTRLGSTREIDVDVRIVAATNRDPEAAMADGKLRPDLFHRINVFPIPLPSLRERGDDIPMLADAFLQQFNAESGRNLRFAPAAREALKTYAWPGNVRELRNFVQRASIFSDTNVIDTLPPPIMDELSNLADSHEDRVTVPFGTSLDEVDRRVILGTIAQCGGVKAQAAEVLDVSLKTIYNRLAQLEDEADKPES